MINVLGLGPGSKDYILPITLKTISECDLVIGAKRNLDCVKDITRSSLDLSKGLSYLGEYLNSHQRDNIAVVVSGDSGFYSLLDFVKRNVDCDNINVIPGISSLQYMYSKLKRGYETTNWISLHGRDSDIERHIKNRVNLGILTDKKQNSRFIAKKLISCGIDSVKIHIGERLSYCDENINSFTVKEALEYVADDLSVVVIEYE